MSEIILDREWTKPELEREVERLSGCLNRARFLLGEDFAKHCRECGGTEHGAVSFDLGVEEGKRLCAARIVKLEQQRDKLRVAARRVIDEASPRSVLPAASPLVDAIYGLATACK